MYLAGVWYTRIFVGEKYIMPTSRLPAINNTVAEANRIVK